MQKYKKLIITSAIVEIFIIFPRNFHDKSFFTNFTLQYVSINRQTTFLTYCCNLRNRKTIIFYEKT